MVPLRLARCGLAAVAALFALAPGSAAGQARIRIDQFSAERFKLAFPASTTRALRRRGGRREARAAAALGARLHRPLPAPAAQLVSRGRLRLRLTADKIRFSDWTPARRAGSPEGEMYSADGDKVEMELNLFRRLPAERRSSASATRGTRPLAAMVDSFVDDMLQR